MIDLFAQAAVDAPGDWRAWVTPENVIAVLSSLAARFGWLGRAKYKRVVEAVVVGVEHYRRSEDTTPADSADVARSIREQAERSGVEHVLGPLVKSLTKKRPAP